MKIFAWVFFALYTAGLIISVLPLLGMSAVWAMLGVSYVAFAQFWVIWVNKDGFRGFFRSSIFHLIPVVILTYVIGSQMLYYLLSDAAENKAQQLGLSLLSLVLPFVIIWLQYAIFAKAYKSTGILNASN